MIIKIVRRQVIKMIDFNPFPNMETKNLILRRMNSNDAKDLFEMRKDPRMNEYTDMKLEEDIYETRAYIDRMNEGIDDNKWIIWAIEYKQSHKVIGTVCIWNINEEQKIGELGYGIMPDYQGQGLMKESLLSVIEYGFNIMNLEEILAYTEENNLKSINLLEKCKFVEINRVQEEGYLSSKVYNMVVYRLENHK
ncbi:GNAT family N-acetyltransferase [Tissierella carlieri]|uniref:GNAT family N-acetyltransferase n=2 Tax=Tissierella TaxID=41273 RepID=UPI00386DE6B9